jgi:hypothetical protein
MSEPQEPYTTAPMLVIVGLHCHSPAPPGVDIGQRRWSLAAGGHIEVPEGYIVEIYSAAPVTIRARRTGPSVPDIAPMGNRESWRGFEFIPPNEHDEMLG